MLKRNLNFSFFILAYCFFSCAMHEKLKNNDITIEVIQNIGNNRDLYNEIKKFYIEIAGYGGDLNEDDTVIIARKNEDLVGSCRVSTEENVKILRRLFIVPHLQRHGIGTLLVKKVEEILQKELCFCFSIPEVKSFYTKLDWQECDHATIPEVIAKRYLMYKNKNLDTIIMKK